GGRCSPDQGEGRHLGRREARGEQLALRSTYSMPLCFATKTLFLSEPYMSGIRAPGPCRAYTCSTAAASSRTRAGGASRTGRLVRRESGRRYRTTSKCV